MLSKKNGMPSAERRLRLPHPSSTHKDDLLGSGNTQTFLTSKKRLTFYVAGKGWARESGTKAWQQPPQKAVPFAEAFTTRRVFLSGAADPFQLHALLGSVLDVSFCGFSKSR